MAIRQAFVTTRWECQNPACNEWHDVTRTITESYKRDDPNTGIYATNVRVDMEGWGITLDELYVCSFACVEPAIVALYHE